MRLVVINGVQYDADNLPASIDAKGAVPLEEWYAQNRVEGTPANARQLADRLHTPAVTAQAKTTAPAKSPKRARRSGKK